MKVKVLVVDDEFLIRMSLDSGLSDLGYQVRTTQSIREGVELAETFRPGDVLFSLMSQYTPQPGAQGRLARRLTRAEYRAAADYMHNCGITDGFTQERTAAREEYTPAFDLTGV